MEDFVYACIQLVHNLGAAAVVGNPAIAWWFVSSNKFALVLKEQPVVITSIKRRLAWLTIFAWSTQIASGAGFGATTYYLKHELPELTGVGLAALEIKVSCAIICFILTLLYLQTGSRWLASSERRLWQTLFALGMLALMSAAFLRWYG